jgi:hypothetical protein
VATEIGTGGHGGMQLYELQSEGDRGRAESEPRE